MIKAAEFSIKYASCQSYIMVSWDFEGGQMLKMLRMKLVIMVLSDDINIKHD